MLKTDDNWKCVFKDVILHFNIILIFAGLLGDVLYTAHHLLYLYEFFIYFCMILHDHFSQKWQLLLSSIFHSIFGFVCHIASKLSGVITQPWRHLGAILWIHVIIHIFINIHHKLIKFNSHKFQVMGQYTNASMSARASNLKIAQNHFLNNFEYEPGHFKHFKNVLIARISRTERRNAFFGMDLTSDTILSGVTNF